MLVLVGTDTFSFVMDEEDGIINLLSATLINWMDVSDIISYG